MRLKPPDTPFLPTMISVFIKSIDRTSSSVREWMLRVVSLFTLCFALSSHAQFLEAGGPFIDDQLPWGYRMGGGGNIVGPQFVGFRRTRAGSGMLRSLTSASAVFDNGSLFSAASLDSGIVLNGVNFTNWLQTTTGGGVPNGVGFKMGLGPLILSDFIGGLGAFYTDFDTPQGDNDDSGFSSAVTLSASATLQLPFISLGGRLSGYYLPNEDRWGYGLPSPFMQFGLAPLGFIDPGANLIIGTKGSLAGWDFVVYDNFVAEAIAPDITDYLFDDIPLGQLTTELPSAFATDRVGRYQFGGRAHLGGEPGANERFQSPRFSGSGAQGLLSEDRLFFTNSAGAVIGKLLTPTVRNLYWLRRDDFWATNQFNEVGNFISGGGYIETYGNVYFRPYAGYELGTFDEFQSVHHVIRSGSWGAITPSISYSANIGWVWTTGNTNDQNSGIYELMLAQSLGTRFQQYIGGGRTVSDPTYGERYLMDYVTYGFSYLIDSNTVIQAVAGMSRADGVLSASGNSEQYQAGVRLRRAIGKSFLSISAINEHYDFNATEQQIEQWVYKVIYSFPLGGPRTTAYTGYQYIDRRSNRNPATFTEHLLMFYVTQRF